MHFVAGPWFAVLEPGVDGWTDYGEVWLSDGQSSGPGLLQIRIKFAEQEWPAETGGTP
ncbi:MAG: hypothetical protein VX899_01375 [Myxococcota bacterium]|nr:hypothetical protein [Myxococcota bacterium]